MTTAREKELEEEVRALRAVPCKGNPQHRQSCKHCGYCARCHVTNYGRFPNGESAADHSYEEA